MGKWELTLKVTSNISFDRIKKLVAQEAKRIADCKSVKDCFAAWSGGDGFNEESCYLTLECPVTERIKQLRLEADELEKSLK